MQHLNMEDLARLVDESPTDEERAHLAACASCHDALEGLRLQTAALAELPLLEAPGRAWPLLEAKLMHEGLLRAPGSASGNPWGGTRLLRAAAYVGLFLLGGASGLAVGRASSAPPMDVAPMPDVAAYEVEQAEAAYLNALSRYQESSGLAHEADPAARLAALEGIVLSTRAALEAAPADPVINGYYLTALGQRDAVLRQIVQSTGDPWF